MVRLYPVMFPVIGDRKQALIVLMEIPNGWQEKFFFIPEYWILAKKNRLRDTCNDKWSLENELPDNHSFKGIRPSGKSGVVLNGVPQKAGTYEVSLTVENQKGQVNGTFNVDVLASAPRVQTADATQIGSSSARLQADAF